MLSSSRLKTGLHNRQKWFGLLLVTAVLLSTLLFTGIGSIFANTIVIIPLNLWCTYVQSTQSCNFKILTNMGSTMYFDGCVWLDDDQGYGVHLDSCHTCSKVPADPTTCWSLPIAPAAHYGCTNSACICKPQCTCIQRLCPVTAPATGNMTNPADINGGQILCGGAYVENCYGNRCDPEDGQSCGCTRDCNPVISHCPPSYSNTPPLCSLLPASLTMIQTDTPQQVNLTVTDADYGDNVKISAIESVNSCVTVTTLAGGSVLGLLVKAGSTNPSNISQTTALLADPRGPNGVFVNVGGRLLCQGDLRVTVRDDDSDGTGPDVSSSAICPIPVTVEKITTPSCSCTNTACPAVTPSSKFMTDPYGNFGTYTTCANANDCNPVVANCPQAHRNKKPSCSILPSSIVMKRSDAPLQVTLSVTDQDYGDTVQIISAETVNYAGDLNSCVRVTTLGGGGVLNLTAKTGSDNPSDITQSTPLLLDPQILHGVFEKVNGKSLCSGFLEVKILDIDSDDSGPDTSESFTCRVTMSVENDYPVLSDVSIYDMDAAYDPVVAPALREKGGTGDLIDGRDYLIMGSVMANTRASYCNSALDLQATPISCPDSSIQYDMTPNPNFSRKRNPIKLEFTVSDANGRKDILQAGFWIQQIDVNKDNAVVPLVQNGDRKSFQATYSEKENIQIVAGNQRWNFVSKACIGSLCGAQELQLSSKLLFSGLAFIQELGPKVNANGNIKEGVSQWASAKSWFYGGFPDCLGTTIGCLDNNTPPETKIDATSDTLLWSNYEWSVAADSNHMLCFGKTYQVPTVISIGTVATTCPPACAACASQLGVQEVSGNPNALRFSFGVYINDGNAQGGIGMKDGEYALFLSAVDKVGVPLYNVTGKGEEGWLRINKNGVACTGVTCSAGQDFGILYDSTPPSAAIELSIPTNTDGEVLVTYTLSDALSGVSGVSNRYVVSQPNLSTPLSWATDSSLHLLDGKLDYTSAVVPPGQTGNTTVTVGGIFGKTTLVAGGCIYDKAGNMSCNRSAPFTVLTAWIKTSYGDVFSSKDAGITPFSMTLPSNTSGNVEATENLYLPYWKQQFTGLTGALLTASITHGIEGGNTAGNLGFQGNYRDAEYSPFNVYGYTPLMPGNEYARLRAYAYLNCDLLNSATPPNSCNKDGSLGAANFNVITLPPGNVDWSSNTVTCTGANIVFVPSGTLTIGEVKKNGVNLSKNGCLFVLNSGSGLSIVDIVNNGRTGNGPASDRFEAGIVANQNATIVTVKSSQQGTYTVGGVSKPTFDNLKITGFMFSANKAPSLLREITLTDALQYPSEWVSYDANLLEVLRPLIGLNKTADLTCGTSGHVLCQ